MNVLFIIAIWVPIFIHSYFFHLTRKKFQAGYFFGTYQIVIFFMLQVKNYAKFGYKCISRHQIPLEKIHLIDSEGSQNKEQHFNCMKCQKFIRLKDILD